MSDWLKDAKARSAAASPGPWEWSERPRYEDADGLRTNDADATFIVAARSDLPRAIAALEAADRLVAAIQEREDWCRDMGHNPDGCDFCCGGGDEAGQAVEVALAAYREARK